MQIKRTIQTVIPIIKRMFKSSALIPSNHYQTAEIGVNQQLLHKFEQFQLTQEAIPPEYLREVIQGPYQNLNAKFLSALSQDAYSQCLKYAKNGDEILDVSVHSMDIQRIAKYSELVLKGIKSTIGNRPFKFISLGQSPATIARYLELQGQNTAIVPCSELSRATSQELDLLKNNDTYFHYLKNFGLDTDKPDKDTTYILSDYTCSGKSLKAFLKVLKHKLPYEVKVLTKSLQDLARKKSFLKANNDFASSFETRELWTESLKYFYSPIFQLPYSQAEQIEKIHKQSIGSDQNIRGNKLFILWFDKMFKQGKNPAS